MSWRILVLALVLLGFVALTALVLVEHGYLGFFELALANRATQLLAFDLVVCLGLVALWMWRDAQARGAHVASYLVISLLFGAAGPLLYLIARERQTTGEPIPQRA